MRTLFILMDSLNRRFLDLYGAEEPALTPNIDRLAARSVVFDQHWCGSSPCMPARRDIMTGRLNFMERPWGGIEPYDHTLGALLAEKNVYTHMETDHFHYAERGGENYWGHFTSWNLHRGTEHDAIHWGPDKTGVPDRTPPAGYCGLYSPSYEEARRLWQRDGSQYPTPRTFSSAAEWLERNQDADNFLLWVEAFDPHEPFDVPEEFLELYPDDEKNPGPGDPYWPDYISADNYTPEQIRYFRRRYKALLTMADRYLGKLLDVLDRHHMWDDTLVILTTDHGYLLGEHGFMAKCYMPDYNEIHHIPLMISMPGTAPGRCQALTENIDLFPTLLSCFGVSLDRCRNPIHGKSLLPLLRGEAETVRDELLFGVFGKTVGLYDGRYVYLCAKVREENEPLYIYGANMSVLNAYIGYDTMSREEIDTIEMGRFLLWTNFPVYRVPAASCHWNNNGCGFARLYRYIDGSALYDLCTDYAQQHPLEDPVLERSMRKKLIRAMRLHDAPKDQFIRLGLEAETE